MKKIVYFLLAAMLTSITAYSAEKNTTVVVKQLTENQRSSLPDKTIEVKLQRMRANDKGHTALADSIVKCLNYLREEDLNNDVYQLTLSQLGDGIIAVAINSVNDLTKLDAEKAFYGILVGNTHKPCLIVKTGNNSSLLKQVFKKADGKQMVVQEFEFVEEVISRDEARIEGRWDPSTHKFTPSTFLLNGSDLLHPSSAPADE